MTELFLNRLQESLESFEGEEVELVLVANKVVNKYVKPDDEFKVTLAEILKVQSDPKIDEHISTWVLLCAQVLLLRHAKTLGDTDTFKSLGDEIKKTLDKFDNLN
jgi:hypothetical protein